MQQDAAASRVKRFHAHNPSIGEILGALASRPTFTEIYGAPRRAFKRLAHEAGESGRERGGPDSLAERYRKSPMGRFGRVEEVLDAMMYLMTPRSSYMTGQVLALDGGLTIA